MHFYALRCSCSVAPNWYIPNSGRIPLLHENDCTPAVVFVIYTYSSIIHFGFSLNLLKCPESTMSSAYQIFSAEVTADYITKFFPSKSVPVCSESLFTYFCAFAFICSILSKADHTRRSWLYLFISSGRSRNALK